MFLNLLRQDWLTRLPGWLELTLLAVTGFAAGFGLTLLRTGRAAITALLMVLLVLALAWCLFRFHLVWFAWLILVAEIGVGLFWAITFNSIRAYIETSVLERSLSLHLPVRRVKQILKHPELLAPSAEKQEVSLLFTDIANWSTISERVTPERLFKLLNKYFEDTIPCIHENEGMVLQLVGDAIFAIWNAPEPQKNHQELACAAALKLRDKLVQFESANESYPLRTRVGLHCGTASVGNCGSADRFVYTALGAETNMASRLEGLNKHLGTEILASDRIVEAVEDKFTWRNLGRFKLKGGDRVMEIYELVGAIETAEASHGWRQKFGNALRHFQRAEWDQAEAALREVIAIHENDGPSRFYLREIEKLRPGTTRAGWFGEVSMEEK
jgi:adenylate cyclase